MAKRRHRRNILDALEVMGTKIKESRRQTCPFKTNSGYRRVNQENAPLIAISPTKMSTLPMATYCIRLGIPKLGCL